MVRADFVRLAAVAGAFYPDDRVVLKKMISRQLDYGRELLAKLEDDGNDGDSLPQGAPKAVIVPHAGYVYSGTTAALAYALLERGRGTIRRAVIVGPTHRVPVRGVACSSAVAFETPLGTVPIDVASERRALGLLSGDDADRPDDVGGALRSGMCALPDAPAPALIVDDPTHAQEHAVEVQIPFLQTVFGPDLEIVPLNAGDATPREVGDVLRALWGGPETVIVISSDLSHYHPQEYARELDDETIDAIAHLHGPIHPRRACGAYPVNGLLDVLARGLHPDSSPASQGSAAGDDVAFDLLLLGRSTSGDDGVVALAGEPRPAMRDPDEAVVGYSSFAIWQESESAGGVRTAERDAASRNGSDPASEQEASGHDAGHGVDRDADHGTVLLKLARAAIREHLGLDDDPADRPNAIIARHSWLDEPGASFVTLTEQGDLRGCIGTLEAYRSLGRDVADHAVDAASRDPRFMPVTSREYPLLDVEVSVLSRPEPIAVRSRTELERALKPGEDGLILADGRGRRATFLPQVWEQLPDPHDFVSHLLAKAGITPSLDWDHSEIECERYGVTAYAERE
ncbi:AmmeMemoRadiSam system protein B [Bifidobacterium callitrichos]|uniref:AmmeMemoRadiSam system protein B n=1 Tax=Bifidobacterium callitrichos TaxID=762209 RepID=A0A5M9ZFG8_9BIFI|nr:AmmeMemoRadiSam system protein B [Bifidobacterium callitrichos]KAA8817683.1 AmmeMemoRadiSam system protein B [Bifidobacterium callitrichos]